MEPQPPNVIKVFCSYSQKDEDLRAELEKHLKILEQQGQIAVWYDRQIIAGEEWKEEIDEHLESADIILLLISPDFMSSHYCHDIEMPRAMERHNAGEALVIPILLRHVNWQEAPFSKLQILPTHAKPVTSWTDHDEAFVIISNGIQRTVEMLNAKRETSEAVTAEKPLLSAPIPRPPLVGFVSRRDAHGRDIVERLKEELTQQGNQPVTLSGPGGIGKTTLAAEAARALKEVFGGRIVWSSAEKRTDFMLYTLLDDIATQLGRADLRTLAPDLKAEQVRALVSDPPTLIVLDNYEPISTDAKRLIEEWFALAQCSALFTSRHRINGTRNLAIAAMSLEEAHDYLKRVIEQTQDPQIFSDEVRQRIYETAEANPYVMQWVVAQIDEAQEPRTVLDELQHGKGDAAERVFDRSFNLPLLGEDGRATLLALSLFVPSASRYALAEVAGFGDNLRRMNEALTNLRALWLIKGLEENRRFTIEGLTRTLARARLSKDDRAAEFSQRFITHFLNYAEAHAQPMPEDYDALEAEKDNVLGAMDEAFRLSDWASVTRLMDAINYDGVNGLLTVRGYWDEAIRRGKQASRAAHKLSDQWQIVRFTHNLAIMYQSRGELEEARRLYDESLEIKRKLGDQTGIAITSHQLGLLAKVQGDLEEARRLYDESLEIAKKLGDQSGVALTIGELGNLSLEQGDRAKAKELFEEALNAFQQLQDQVNIAGVLHQLGLLAQAQGGLEEARRLYDESLEIKRKLGNQSGIAITLHQLAMLAQAQGDLEEARRLYDESLEIAKKLGNQSGIASTLHELGRLAQNQGDLEEARRLYDESLEIKRKLGDQSGIAITLGQLGRLAEDEGNREEAVRLMREALGIFEKLRSPNAEIARGNLKRLEGKSS